jgi:hypothetical protein
MPLDPEDDEFPTEGDTPALAHDEPASAANVDTNMTGPVESSSDAPPDVEPQAVSGEAPSTEGERAEGAGEAEAEPLPEFDPKVRESFTGLLFIGKLQKEFRFLGHEFVIRTLTTDETLEVALLQRPYRDTMGDLRAYQAALIAACTVTVDGEPLQLPLTNDPEDSGMAARFRYVRKNWYPVVLDQVYEQYLLLEADVAEVIAAMGEARG